MPVSPPMPNIGRNAVAKSIGTLNRIEPPQSEMKNALKMMTDGIEMIIVVVWKNALTDGAHAGQPHVVGPDDEGEEPENERRENERLVTPERLARVVRDDLGHNPHAGQDEHVNFRMPEEPKQMLPEKRAAAAADVQRRAVHDQPARHEKAGRRPPGPSAASRPRTSSGGKASSSRNAVTNCAQTKNGSRIQVMPLARSWMMVAMKLTAPRSDGSNQQNESR